MDENLQKGMAVRRELFGEERLKSVFAPKDVLTQKFQGLMTSACFGQVWGDESVPHKDRSLVTISILGAQHRFKHFEHHVRLAVRNGCSRDQIIAVVQHLYTYCGAPTGVEAYQIVHQIFEESDVETT